MWDETGSWSIDLVMIDYYMALGEGFGAEKMANFETGNCEWNFGMLILVLYIFVFVLEVFVGLLVCSCCSLEGCGFDVSNRGQR